jgi:hypothetical protein
MMEFLKKLSKPGYFSDIIGNSAIFCLSTGA